MTEAPGQVELRKVKFAGFSDQEISDWKAQKTQEYIKAGFSNQEVMDYFGEKPVDTTPMKDYVNGNLQKISEAEGQSDAGPKVQKEAQSFMDAFTSGLQISTAGLAIRQEAPDVILPEHSSKAMNIASQIGTLIGDVPAMALGGFLGSVAGAPVGGAVGTAAVPGIGTLGGVAAGLTVGAGAGAFALPAALRKIMMDHYEKGDITTPGEFWDRLSSTTWETLKQGTVGAATFGVGKVVGAGAKALGAGEGLATFSQVSSEIGTMTTVGAAVEGHLPKADDFIVAGILVGGIHGTLHVAGKARGLYAKTGVKPQEIVEMSKSDPILRQELLSDTKPEISGEKVSVKVDGSFKSVEGPGAKVTETLEFHPDKTKVVTEDIKPFNPDIPRTEAETKVLSRLGEQVTSTDKAIDINKLKQNLLDDLNPLNEVTKELSLKPEDNPYIQARLYRGWHGKLERVLDFNTFDFKTGKTVTGEGFGQIIKDIPKQDKDGFTAYALSKRAIEKEAQGVKTGIDLEAAQEVVKTNAHFEDTFRRLVSFQDRMLDYAKEAGLVNKEQAKTMKAMNKDYIPFHRVQDIDPFDSGSVAKNIFKKMTGSERAIVDPIDSVMQNTAAIIRAAEKNRVYNSFVEAMSLREDGNSIVRKSERKVKPIEITDKEGAKYLDKLGVDPNVAAEAFTVFRGKDQVFKDNSFVAYKDGKATVYEVRPDVSDALKALDVHSGVSGLWADIFIKLPAQVLRFGVTATPDFVFRNFFRDQLTVGVQSKFKQLPFVDIAQSLGHMWKKDSVWQNYLSSGGASGEFGAVARYIESDVFTLNKQTGFLNAAQNVIKTPFQALGALSQTIEQLPRFTEYRKGGQSVESAYAAREVSVDFSRGGLKIRALNAMVPFMNVGVQGIDKTIRHIKENPKTAIANATAMITLPTAMLWYANKDDSRYKDAPNWQKDLFWLIPTDKWEPAMNQADAFRRPEDLRRQRPDGTWEVNNGTVYRLPKPFEYGMIFGSMFERALDGLYRKDGDKAFKDFGETLSQAIVPNVIPTAIAPAIEQRFNESFFTKRPIVPNHLEDVNAELQYTEYTSETAKALGKLIQAVPGLRDFGPKSAPLASPLVIDNYIRNWTGTLGQYALQIADKALSATGIAKTQAEAPLSTLADIPFIKAFVMRNPSAQMQPIQDFYDNYDKTSRTRKSIKALLKDGQIDRAMELSKDPDSVANLDGFRKAMYNHNILIHKISVNDKYSPTEKRQLIDGLYYGMSQLATQGNKILKQLKEEKK